jgi:hypothetical protein
MEQALKLPDTSDFLDVVVNNEPRQLFMSYAILERAVALSGGDQESLISVADTQLRAIMLAQLIQSEKYVESYSEAMTILMQNRVNTEDAVKMIGWFQSHLVNFILGLSQTAELQKSQMLNLLAQLQSKTSSQA